MEEQPREIHIPKEVTDEILFIPSDIAEELQRGMEVICDGLGILIRVILHRKWAWKTQWPMQVGFTAMLWEMIQFDRKRSALLKPEEREIYSRLMNKKIDELQELLDEGRREGR